MSGLEIEKKFLVRNNDYEHQAYSKSHIQQGYICSDRGRTVRVRIRDHSGYLTIKGPSTDDGLSRYEFEKEIELEEAQELMKLCERSKDTNRLLIIEKTRHLVEYGDHVFEVDEFHGDNKGLVIAEVELKPGEDPKDVEMPDFIGDDVTGDPQYYNSYLLKNPFTSWKTDESRKAESQEQQPK